jgi:Skp family chaperone for outer membrane proteins
MPTRLCCLLLLSFALPSVAAAQLPSPVDGDAIRLAYFSPQRAFYESDAGRAVQGKLSSIQAETSKEIEARSAKLKALQGALEQSRSLLGEPALRQREQEIGKFELDIKRFIEDAQAQFLGVRKDLENAFVAKLVPAVASVAKERGLLLVLDQDSGLVVWGDPALDITTDVVRRVDLSR